MTTKERDKAIADAMKAESPFPKKHKIATLLGISRQTLWEHLQAGKVPQKRPQGAESPLQEG